MKFYLIYFITYTTRCGGVFFEISIDKVVTTTARGGGGDGRENDDDDDAVFYLCIYIIQTTTKKKTKLPAAGRTIEARE